MSEVTTPPDPSLGDRLRSAARAVRAAWLASPTSTRGCSACSSPWSSSGSASISRPAGRSSPRATSGTSRSRAHPSRSWRPAWCSSSCRATSTCRSARCSGSSATRWRWPRRCGCRTTLGLGLGPPDDLDHRRHPGAGPGPRRRRPPGLRHRLRRTSRPSSSRSAACSSGAASSSSTPRARRSHRSTRPSGCSAAGHRARWARWASWAVGIVAVAVVLIGLVLLRRRQAKYGFQVRPLWATVVIGVVAVVVILGAVWVANAYPWPEQLANAVRRGQRHRDPGRRPRHPDRDRLPGPHHDRRRRS